MFINALFISSLHLVDFNGCIVYYVKPFKGIESLFTPGDPDRNHAVFQAFLYALILTYLIYSVIILKYDFLNENKVLKEKTEMLEVKYENILLDVRRNMAFLHKAKRDLSLKISALEKSKHEKKFLEKPLGGE